MIPENGRYLSVNDSYEQLGSEGARAVMRKVKGLAGDHKPRSGRYVGSLVADFHRNLLGGGIFVYPANQKKSEGQEAAAALRGESAGLHRGAGRWRRTSDGKRRILDVEPTELHQRSAVVHRQQERRRRAGPRHPCRRSGARCRLANRRPACPPSRPSTARTIRRSTTPRISLDPGQFPFTRGVQPTMYRGRLWTMRQYAGFGTAAETNRRFRMLLDAGQTGLSVAFDLPTQMGIDSDSPRALGEVGRVGVAIDTVEDMHTLLDGIPLDRVSTSMTINATASTLLAMYIVVGEERGIGRDRVERHDSERHPQGIHRAGNLHLSAGAEPRARLGDLSLLRGRSPELESDLDLRLSHPRGRRATAVQELAFRTFANAIEYVTRAVATGLDVDTFAPRLSFFFAAHNDLFEEVAKFRASRRLYSRIMRERFGANDASARLRFHTQTGGVTLQAQQPLNNVVRVAVQALSAVLGGTQSLHTNGYDEALSLPTAEAATLALRTQQIIANESGAALTADPLAGSYYVEHLTNELERRVLDDLLAKVDALGGAAKAISASFFQDEIAQSARTSTSSGWNAARQSSSA